MPSNKQAFIIVNITECQIKVAFVNSTARKVLNFSHLPSFHFQSSPPIYVIDGSGLWITKHCKLKIKREERTQFPVFPLNFRPTH